MKNSRSIFVILAVFMIGFGVLIGILFPFFTHLMGVTKEIAFSPVFFFLCILAGILVGTANIGLAIVTVKKRLKKVSSSMIKVENKLQYVLDENIDHLCSAQDCYIDDSANDEFGKCAHAFNQLLSAFEQSLTTQNAVRRYNRMLTSELNIDSLTKRALTKILSYTKTKYGAVYVVKDGELVLTAVEGIKSADKLINSSHIKDAMQAKQTKVIDLPEGVVLDMLLAEIKPCCIVVEPLVYKDTVLGIMILASTQKRIDKLSHLDMFSQNLALALNNSLKHSQLQTLVAIDPLTEVYNRRFGFVRLEEEYSAAIRSGTSLSLLMLDLDHFKLINDSYGHIAGDKVLKEISKMIKVILRKHDLLIRYGGEEFIAVLPGASTRDAMKVADQIRSLIEQSDIPYTDSHIHMTVSIGVVSFPETQISKLDELIKYADEAMYKSKFAGRNQVTLYETNHLAES